MEKPGCCRVSTWMILGILGYPIAIGFSHGSTRLGNPGRRVANARSAAGGIRDTPIYGHGKSGEKV